MLASTYCLMIFWRKCFNCLLLGVYFRTNFNSSNFFSASTLDSVFAHKCLSDFGDENWDQLVVIMSFISAPSTRQRLRQYEGNMTTVQDRERSNKTINVMACR